MDIPPITITPAMEWLKWYENPPPPRSWVWGRYASTPPGEGVLLKTCRCGRCTVFNTHGWDMVPPREWIAVDLSEFGPIIQRIETEWKTLKDLAPPSPRWEDYAD